MTAGACVSHSSPGRLRFRIPSKKGDTACFDSLKRRCEKISGLKSVEANPFTGSLLLTFDPDARLFPQAIALDLDLDLAPEATSPKPLEERVANQFGLLSTKLRDLTGGEIDLKGVAFLGCLAAGLYQLSVGNMAMPAWFVAFWYAQSLASGK
jgi:hypothetical protein